MCRHGRLSAAKTLGEPTYEPLAYGSVSTAESPRNVFSADSLPYLHKLIFGIHFTGA
jgi:hypothetical protein